MKDSDSGKGGERLRKGRTLAERRWERREALLDAGLDLFGTQGYAATSVEELCRTAYVSTRNFYEEFENREAVLFALGDRLVGEAYEAMVSATIEDGPDRIVREARARVGALAHALLDDPRRARIAFIESLGVSPVQEARRRNAHRLFAQYFAALVRADFDDDGFGSRDEDIYAIALVGAINEILSDWVLRADKPPLDELIDPIVDIIGLMSSRLRGAAFDWSAQPSA
jgi:AcrR family transcriptional regulator